MKYFNKIMLAVLAVGLFAVSCNKEDVNKGIANKEQSLIKLPQSAKEVWTFALDAVPGETSLDVLEIRRDAISESDLNKTMVVKISPNPSAITDYNNANQGSELSLFTNYTNDAGNPFDGTSWNVTFNPGEFVKYIKIKFDPTAMDFSKRNVLAFKVTDGGGAQISNAASTALVEVAVKNKYDGRYKLKGTFYHPNADYQASFEIDVEMHTTGPNSVKMFSPDFGGYYHPFYINSAADYTAFGAQEPNYTIDPATNAVTVNNSYIGAVTHYTMAKGFTQIYDPATKTIFAKFGYNYLPGVVFDPANTREFTDELIYLGPR